MTDTTTTTKKAQGFTIERTFKAAPEKVWEMWTTKAGLMKWWAPSAAEMAYEFTVREIDVRPGGEYAFEMKAKDHTVVNRGTYHVVRPHAELAWTWHFDIFLAPGEKPYDVAMRVLLEKTATGGTKMTFSEGPLATQEHTDGSRKGVEQNFRHLAKALGEA
jgi:uncharacterized protein YndB with AHSA1/START domain